MSHILIWKRWTFKWKAEVKTTCVTQIRIWWRRRCETFTSAACRWKIWKATSNKATNSLSNVRNIRYQSEVKLSECENHYRHPGDLKSTRSQRLRCSTASHLPWEKTEKPFCVAGDRLVWVRDEKLLGLPPVTRVQLQILGLFTLLHKFKLSYRATVSSNLVCISTAHPAVLSQMWTQEHVIFIFSTEPSFSQNVVSLLCCNQW